MLARRILILVAVALLASASAAQATQLWLLTHYGLDYNPYRADITLGSDDLTGVYVGPWLAYRDQGMNQYWADLYCVDLSEGMYNDLWLQWTLKPTNWVNPGDLPGNASQTGLAMAAALYNGEAEDNHLTTEDPEAKRAALQIAIWEALYDYNGDESSLDIEEGDFQFTGGTAHNATVLSYVSTYLDTYAYQSVAMYYDDGQDLIGPIPEPTTLVLLGLGLAGTGLVIRRRRKA